MFKYYSADYLGKQFVIALTDAKERERKLADTFDE